MWELFLGEGPLERAFNMAGERAAKLLRYLRDIARPPGALYRASLQSSLITWLELIHPVMETFDRGEAIRPFFLRPHTFNGDVHRALASYRYLPRKRAQRVEIPTPIYLLDSSFFFGFGSFSRSKSRG